MRILVIGRAGQLARCLVEAASEAGGIGLTAIGRPDVDLETPGSAAAAVAAARADLVVNAAAYTAVDQAEDEPERAFRVNGHAAGEIAAAARAAGARLIHVSTDYVFDGTGEGGYPPEAPTRPLSVYGRSKLLGEELVRAQHPDHVIVRTAWVYSVHGRNFLKTMMELARARDEVSVVADQFGNPSSAHDLAEGLLAICRSWRRDPVIGLGQTYHLAGEGSTNWAGFAEFIFRACAEAGLPTASVRPIGTEEWPTKAVRPRNSRLDCSKFADDFGYEMPYWQSSASAVISSLKSAAGEGNLKLRKMSR